MTCARKGWLTRGLRLAALLAVVLVLSRAQPAAAETTDFPPLVPPSLSHRGQIGLALLPGSGFRVLIPYAENVYCGKPGERVCSARLPFFLDVQPSFGLGPHWDAVVDLRFGLEADFARTHQFAFVPGFRYWVEPEARLEALRHAPGGVRHHRATQSLAPGLRPRVSQQQRSDVRDHVGPWHLRPARGHRGLRPLVALRGRFGRGCSSTLSVARLR